MRLAATDGWRRVAPRSQAGVEDAGGEALLRARRTWQAVDAGAGWVWPYWLERQLDPANPSFVASGDLALVTNSTGRNWTTIGNVGSSPIATVDPRGLVTQRPDGWSLDWWVGAEDRWHLPSREAAVRQRGVGDAPVVETAMRVPGGDIVHRAYAVRTAPGDGAVEMTVVEVENATPVPVALVVAVRPYNPEGVAAIERIALQRTGSGSAVVVDGSVAVLLPRSPNRAEGSTGSQGDVSATVLGGDADTAFPDELRCPDGLATAAFLYPLAHRTTLRFLLPMSGRHDDTSRRRNRRRDSGAGGQPAPRASGGPPLGVPTAGQVANGWKAHAARGMRLVLPDERLSAAVEASRRFLLLHHGDAGTSDWLDDPRFDSGVSRLSTLDRYGYVAEVDEVVEAYPDVQRSDGSFGGGGALTTAAALHAVGDHWRLHRDVAVASGMGPVVAAGAESLVVASAGSRPGRAAGENPLGKRPSGTRPAGERGATIRSLWSVRGMLDAAAVLGALDETGAAEAAAAEAERLLAGVDASLTAVADRLGREGPQGASGPAVDRDLVELLSAPRLGLVAADDPRMASVVEAVRERWCQGPAVFDRVGRTGLRPDFTLQLASVELAAGDRRALDRLDWVVGAATSTWTWPAAVHPRLGSGSWGDGHDGRVGAELLRFVRNLLVRETFDDGLALCSLVPTGWLGQPLEVHDAPTHHGPVSFAVRWHGDRPALLWELLAHDGSEGVRITAPGLDPTWCTTEAKGDALLAPVAPPDPPEPPEPPQEVAVPATPVSLRRRPRPS